MATSGATALGARVVSPLSPGERSAIIAMRLPAGTVAADEVASRLFREHGILVSSRAGLLRVSPHICNTEEDISRFLQGLECILSTRAGARTEPPAPHR